MRHSRRRSTLQQDYDDNDDEHDGNDFGDDFDDFEEGAQAGADDDFGDFGEGFQEPEAEAESVETTPVSTSQRNSIPAKPFVSLLARRLSVSMFVLILSRSATDRL